VIESVTRASKIDTEILLPVCQSRALLMVVATANAIEPSCTQMRHRQWRHAWKDAAEVPIELNIDVDAYAEIIPGITICRLSLSLEKTAKARLIPANLAGYFDRRRPKT